MDSVRVEPRQPDIGAVERNPDASGAIPLAQLHAIAATELEQIGVARHPYVRPVKRDPVRLARRLKRTQSFAIASPELVNGAIPSVGYPHVGAVKGDTERSVAHVERPEDFP